MKNKSNLELAIEELSVNNNNAVSFVYPNPIHKDGVLEGAIVTIKDVYATQDASTQASSRILTDFQPCYNATIIEKLKSAGATIVAKTHTDELALGGTGTFSAWGLITNPLDSTRMVGGSSSGAAATFSSNIDIAIGSDTGDSVRLPASYGGYYGFKPSYGAVSRYGQFAFASSLDTVAYFAHNVSDLILTSKVLFGEDEKDFSSRNVEAPIHEIKKPKSVAFLTNNVGLPSYLVDKYSKLQKVLEQDGIKVNMVSLDENLLEAIETTYMVISFSEASSNNSNLTGVAFGQRQFGNDWREIITKTRTSGFGRMVQRRFTLGAFYLSEENQVEVYKKACQVRGLIRDNFNQIYKDNDLLVFPATTIAPKLTIGKDRNWFASYLAHANLSGNPSLVIPWGEEENLPFGLVLDTKLYNDRSLLSYALYFESLLGGSSE